MIMHPGPLSESGISHRTIANAVRRTAADPAMQRWLDENVPFALRCQQCGGCAAACPGQRHGGIRPAELMARASLGSVDVSSDAMLWRCARCMACSERCPSDADPGEVIASLREAAVARGNRPQYFIEEAKRFVQTGICFPRTGMTRKIRKELALPDMETSPAALRDIEEICRRTALGRVKLE